MSDIEEGRIKLPTEEDVLQNILLEHLDKINDIFKTDTEYLELLEPGARPGKLKNNLTITEEMFNILQFLFNKWRDKNG